MKVMTKRNAALGSATLLFGRKILRRGEPRRRRLTKPAIFTALAAAGGALLFWRKKKKKTEQPTDAQAG